MEESINGYNEELYCNMFQKGRDTNQTPQNRRKIYALRNNSGIKVQSGEKTTLPHLENLSEILSHRAEAQESVHISRDLFQNNMMRLGEECDHTLCRLLDEELWKDYKNVASAKHIKLTFPS